LYVRGRGKREREGGDGDIYIEREMGGCKKIVQ
jgi:hypothetical protein